jgi:hypothetical protein
LTRWIPSKLRQRHLRAAGNHRCTSGGGDRGVPLFRGPVRPNCRQTCKATTYGNRCLRARQGISSVGRHGRAKPIPNCGWLPDRSLDRLGNPSERGRNMNIGASFSKWAGVILRNSRWIWLLLSVLGSAYFAFWLWPWIYALSANLVVNVHFEVSPGDDVSVPFFVLNMPTQRAKYRGRIADKDSFYYTPCAVLDCDPNKTTWVRLSPKELGCSDVVGCTVERHKLSEQNRNDLRLTLRTQGKGVEPPPTAKTSVSDPGGWGDRGRWPVFLFCVFLAIKFGKALDEFLFQPHRKQASN